VTRIISGSAGGRRLATPSGVATRPTSDRVREAIFSAVEHAEGSLAGLRFLDLYAGSGAVGLEAVSRGAAGALLVEHDRRVAQVIRSNIAALGLRDAALRVGRVDKVVASGPPAGRAFEVAFLDPPYTLATPEVVGVLEALLTHGWLTPRALVVVERSVRSPALEWPAGYEAGRCRRYGETCVWYGRVAESVTLRPS